MATESDSTEVAEEAAAREARGFDPREYLRLLLAYKWIILGMTTIVSVAVVFWTINQPRIYEASCTVEYDPNPARPLGNQVEDVSGPNASFWMNREFYQTQNRIIGSRIVAEMVVNRIGLNRNPDFMKVRERSRASWHGASVEQAAQTLQERTVIEQLKDTRLVQIRVRDENRQRAAQLANAIADAYMEKTMQDRLGSTVNALEWLSTQLDKVRRDLDGSEMALFQFKQDNNVLDVSMEHRQTTLARVIEEYNIQLTTARAKRIELGARLKVLREANRADPLAVNVSMVIQNASLSTLRDLLNQKIAEREGLLTHYGENHPKIQAVDHEIDAMKTQMRDGVDGLIASAEADLRESQNIEIGLRDTIVEANNAGHELNARDIQYESLLRARENNAKLYNLLLERTTETDLTRMLRVSYVRMVDRALNPDAPVSPRFAANVAGGVLGGIALGMALAFAIAKLDRRIRTAEEVEGLGLTVLGILPAVGDTDASKKRKRRGRNKRDEQVPTAKRDLIVHTQPQSSAAECCRTIRTNLSFMSADRPLRAILVTSASPAEGKTTVATSVAIALAQSGKRVLLVDSDLRRPRIHRTFSISSATPGVTSVLVGDRTLAEAVIVSEVPGLDVLPCGPIPPNPSELLHSSRFHQMLADALANYDRVVFDSPPLGAVTDAAILAPQLDATLVVVKSQRTTRDAIISALRQLRDVKARVAGGVLNDVDLNHGQYGYGYGYGAYYYYRREGYYTTDAEKEGENAAAAEERESRPSIDA